MLNLFLNNEKRCVGGKLENQNIKILKTQLIHKIFCPLYFLRTFAKKVEYLYIYLIT